MIPIKYTRPTGISLVDTGSLSPGSGPTFPSGAVSPQNSSTIPIQPTSQVQGSLLPVQSAASPNYLGNLAMSGGAAETPAVEDAGSSASAGGGIQYPDLSGAIAILRENLSSLDPLYQKSIDKALQDYTIAMNERKANFESAKQASDSSAIANDQTVLNSRNAINKNARMSSEDILSILGALGMGGSTRVKALSTIADKNNTNLNEANYGYGKNKQSILQSWNDFVNKDANQQKQIEDTKRYNEAQAGITRDTGKKDLLSQIASNKIEMGQDTAPELSEMAGLNKNIADLSGVQRTYTGETPTYTAPSISSLLGQNLARFDVASGSKNAKKTAPKLIKVNEQTPSGSKYGLV